MAYFIIAFISMGVGGGVVYFLTDHWRKDLEEQRRAQEAKHIQLQADEQALAMRDKLLLKRSSQLDIDRSEFERRIVSYSELQTENAILKFDLRSMDISVRKSQLDLIGLRQKQQEIDATVAQLGSRYLKESAKWIKSSLNPNNLASCRQRIIDAVERCRAIGVAIPKPEEDALLEELRADYEKTVRAAAFREEQTRIRAQLREEQQRQQELDRVQKQLARERQAVEEALANALAIAKDQYSEEVELLRAQLAEAESKQRAISQAELTKVGHVYVISNLGSFGDGVFKVGMTRRLEPLDRVKELGDASVPFPFDVHMLIASDDAPALENALHRKLHKLRVNKTNPRKEFFRADINSIHQIVTEHHGTVEYIADAEALQYRQSLTMTDDEEEYIESIFAEFEDENDADADEE